MGSVRTTAHTRQTTRGAGPAKRAGSPVSDSSLAQRPDRFGSVEGVSGGRKRSGPRIRPLLVHHTLMEISGLDAVTGAPFTMMVAVTVPL